MAKSVKRRFTKSRKGSRKNKRLTRKQKGGDQFIKQIIHLWKKRHGGYVKSRNGHYFCSCAQDDDIENHIHIIEENARYIYKRNGEHDNGDGRGFGFYDNGDWCIEDGANTAWNAEQWVDFLNSRMCYSEEFGSCSGNGINNNNNNSSNENDNSYSNNNANMTY